MVMTATVESRPMMTMTTSSSISEKPRSHARERVPAKAGTQGEGTLPGPRLQECKKALASLISPAARS